MTKIRDLFMKVRDTKGIVHAKMGSIFPALWTKASHGPCVPPDLPV